MVEKLRNNSSYISKALIDQVPVHVLKAMMPVQNSLLPRNFLDPLVYKLADLFKMPTKSRKKKDTYFLPVFTWRGFMSAALNPAKNNSTGEAS